MSLRAHLVASLVLAVVFGVALLLARYGFEASRNIQIGLLTVALAGAGWFLWTLVVIATSLEDGVQNNNGHRPLDWLDW